MGAQVNPRAGVVPFPGMQGPTAQVFPVVIVGGGPVGLTLSILLSQYGVDHVLVETDPGTSRHPKARGIAARSMEIFRRAGVEDDIRRAGLPADQVLFYRGRTLTDPDFARTEPVHPCLVRRAPPHRG